MDKMATSFPFTTIILTAFLHCCFGSTSIKGIHMCSVVMIDTSSTDQNRQTAFMKFDFIPLPSGDNPLPSTTDPLITSTSENITTADLLQSTTTNGVATDSVTTPFTTTVITSTTTTQPDDNTSCGCSFYSNTITAINILKVWSESLKYLYLQIKEDKQILPFIPIEETLERTFNQTSITLSVANSSCLTTYSMFIQIQGDFRNITCNQSAVISAIRCAGIEGVKKEAAFKANAELLFETPLLIIGAVLAVTGILLMVAGIAVLRRYRKERRKNKGAETLEMTDFPQSNYDVISNSSGNSNTVPKIESDDFPRKVSASSTTKLKLTQDDTRSSRSKSLDVTATLGFHPGNKTPSPNTTKHKKRSCISLIKSKRKIDKINDTKNSTIDDEEMYSSVDLYETTQSHTPTARDNRVATPLLLLLNSETKQKPLRTIETWSESKTKAMTMPKKGLPGEVTRVGKSYSYHQKDAPNYDETDDFKSGGDKARCKTADVVQNPFRFPTNSSSSNHPKEIGVMHAEDERKRTSENSIQEEHIYEAVEKDVAETADKEKLQPSQDDDYSTKTQNPENAITQSDSSVNAEEMTIRTDQSNSQAENGVCEPMAGMNTTGYDNGKRSKRETLAKAPCVDVDEARSDNEMIRLSTIDITHRAKSDRQYSAIVQTSPTKQGDDQSDITNSGGTDTGGDNSINGKNSAEIVSREALKDSETNTSNTTPYDLKTDTVFDKEVDTNKNRTSRKFNLEEYVVVENILYESVTLSQHPTVNCTPPK